jgi:hypothetical protein
MIRKIICADKTQIALLIDGNYSYEINAEEVMLGTGRRIKVFYTFLIDDGKLRETTNQVSDDINNAIDNKMKELNK